jgi:hypothetical protein
MIGVFWRPCVVDVEDATAAGAHAVEVAPHAPGARLAGAAQVGRLHVHAHAPAPLVIVPLGKHLDDGKAFFAPDEPVRTARLLFEQRRLVKFGSDRLADEAGFHEEIIHRARGNRRAFAVPPPVTMTSRRQWPAGASFRLTSPGEFTWAGPLSGDQLRQDGQRFPIIRFLDVRGQVIDIDDTAGCIHQEYAWLKRCYPDERPLPRTDTVSLCHLCPFIAQDRVGCRVAAGIPGDHFGPFGTITNTSVLNALNFW